MKTDPSSICRQVYIAVLSTSGTLYLCSSWIDACLLAGWLACGLAD